MIGKAVGLYISVHKRGYINQTAFFAKKKRRTNVISGYLQEQTKKCGIVDTK